MARRFLLLILIGWLAACAAPDRYLSTEQDQMMRESCEPEGCVVIPNPDFEELIKKLGVAI